MKRGETEASYARFWFIGIAVLITLGAASPFIRDQFLQALGLIAGGLPQSISLPTWAMPVFIGGGIIVALIILAVAFINWQNV